jgi:hypothetical protein
MIYTSFPFIQYEWNHSLKEPYYETQEYYGKEKSTSTKLVVIFFDLLIAFLFILVLFARQYHFTTTTFFPGTFVHFDVGLFRVHVSGDPSGILPRFQPKVTQDIACHLISNLNGKTLAELEAYACMTSGYLMSVIPSGCSTITSLRIASMFLIGFFSLASFALVVASILTAFIDKCDEQTRYLITSVCRFLHIAPTFLSITGSLCYILIGGLDLQLIPNTFFLIQDVNFFDIGTGYFYSLILTIISLIIPLLSYLFLLSSTDCQPQDTYSFDGHTNETTFFFSTPY